MTVPPARAGAYIITSSEVCNRSDATEVIADFSAEYDYSECDDFERRAKRWALLYIIPIAIVLFELLLRTKVVQLEN
jgi:hypothetical protein